MDCDEACTLLTRTLELAKARRLDDIYELSDGRLPYFWIRSFREGRFKSPSVNRIQFLYELLSGNKLEIKA